MEERVLFLLNPPHPRYVYICLPPVYNPFFLLRPLFVLYLLISSLSRCRGYLAPALPTVRTFVGVSSFGNRYVLPPPSLTVRSMCAQRVRLLSPVFLYRARDFRNIGVARSHFTLAWGSGCVYLDR